MSKYTLQAAYINTNALITINNYDPKYGYMTFFRIQNQNAVPLALDFGSLVANCIFIIAQNIYWELPAGFVIPRDTTQSAFSLYGTGGAGAASTWSALIGYSF